MKFVKFENNIINLNMLKYCSTESDEFCLWFEADKIFTIKSSEISKEHINSLFEKFERFFCNDSLIFILEWEISLIKRREKNQKVGS